MLRVFSGVEILAPDSNGHIVFNSQLDTEGGRCMPTNIPAAVKVNRDNILFGQVCRDGEFQSNVRHGKTASEHAPRLRVCISSRSITRVGEAAWTGSKHARRRLVGCPGEQRLIRRQLYNFHLEPLECTESSLAVR